MFFDLKPLSMHRDKKKTSIICEKMLVGTFSNHQTAANLRKLQRFVLVLKVLLTLQPVYNYQKPLQSGILRLQWSKSRARLFSTYSSQLANPSIQELPTMADGVSKHTSNEKKSWLFRAYRRLYIYYPVIWSSIINHDMRIVTLLKQPVFHGK